MNNFTKVRILPVRHAPTTANEMSVKNIPLHRERKSIIDPVPTTNGLVYTLLAGEINIC